MYEVLSVAPPSEAAPSTLLVGALSLALDVAFLVGLHYPLRREVEWLKSKAQIDPQTQLLASSAFRSDIAALCHCTSSLVVLYMRLHRLDLREPKPRRPALLLRAVRLLEAMLPRSADRLYRLEPTGTFGAVLPNCPELFGIRLALSIIEGLRSQELTATIAIASTETLGWCDFELAAAAALEQQIEKQRGAWCIATSVPPKKPRPYPLADAPAQSAPRLAVQS